MAQSQRRLQVQPLLQDRVKGAESLQPQASPTNVYFPPTLPKPILDQVVDLAPLSQTLSGIVQAHQQAALATLNKQRAGDAAGQANFDTFVKPGESAQQMAKLIQEGKLDPTASPWFYKTQKEVVGRQLMGLYQQEIKKYEDQLISVNDGLTPGQEGPVGQAKMTYEQAHEKAMEYISQSPAYADPLVRAAFQADVMDWGQSYRLQVEGELNKNQKKYVEDGLKETAVTFFQERFKDGWQPEDGDALRAWDKKLRVEQPTVKDPRTIILDGALAAAASFSRQRDNQSAYDLLNNLADVEIGGMKMGDNPAFAEQIDSAMDHYQAETERDGERFVREDAKQTQAALVKGEDLWLPVMNQALDAGEDPLAAVQQLFPQIREQFGNKAEDVVQSARAAAITAQRNQPSPRDLTDALSKAYAEGDPERMALIYQQRAGELTPEDRMTWKDNLQRARFAHQNLNASQVYTSQRDRIATEQKQAITEKVEGDIQRQADNEISDMIQEWEQNARTLVGNVNTPNGQKALDDYLYSGSKEIIAKIREKGQELATTKQDINAKLLLAQSNLGDVQSILDDPQTKSYLTADEYAAWLVKSEDAKLQFAQQFYNSPKTNKILDEIDSAFYQQDQIVTPESIWASTQRRQRFQDLLKEELQPLLGTTPRSQWQDKVFDTALGKAQERLLQELGVKTQASKPLPGETLSQASKRQAKQPQFEQMATDWFTAASKGYQMSLSDLPQNIPPDIRKPILTALRYQSSTIKGGDVVAPLVRDTAIGKFLDQLDSNTALTTQQRGELTGAVLGVRGVTPQEMVDGVTHFQAPIPSLDFSPRWGFLGGDPTLSSTQDPNAWIMDYMDQRRFKEVKSPEVLRQRSQKALDDARAWIKAQEAKGRKDGVVAHVRQQVAEVEKTMRDRTFNIKDLGLNPYTSIRFSSAEELQQWQSDPQRWEALKAAAGVGTGKEEDDKFSGFLWQQFEK